MADRITFSKVEDKNRIVDSFCGHHGYQETVDDGEGKQVANKETKMEFLDKRIDKFIKDSAITFENNQARENQTATISQEINAINIT